MKKVYKYINVIIAVAVVGVCFQSCTTTKQQGCPERISISMPSIK